jgi:hypothetical protein
MIECMRTTEHQRRRETALEQERSRYVRFTHICLFVDMLHDEVDIDMLHEVDIDML